MFFEIANKELNRIRKWLDENLLSVNIDKTTNLPFSLTSMGITDLHLIMYENNGLNSKFCDYHHLHSLKHVKYIGITLY